MSSNSPHNQVAGPGSGRAGTSHWRQQRLTAVVLIPLGLWFAIALLGVDISSHAALVTWIRKPMTTVLLSLTTICLIYHSWAGISVVIEDYVGGESARDTGRLLSSMVHAILVAVCLFSIFRIALGTG